MPKAKAHKVIGTTVGVTVAVGYSHFVEKDSTNAWQYALGGGFGGYITSRLADILEPAKKLGPNHRGIFHGMVLNGVLTGATYKPYKELLQYLRDKAKEYECNDEKFNAMLCRIIVGFILGATCGHVSHLVADLGTPMRLPLLY